MTWRNTYFLPEEVSIHNTNQDCWLTIYGVVKNVTRLIKQFQDTNLIKPIIREAGQDVSYWFEMDGLKPIVNTSHITQPTNVLCSLEMHIFCFLQLKTHLHPETGARVSMLPYRIPHEPIFEPDVSWEPNTATTPWWQDEKYNIGMETIRPINVRLLNPLIKRSTVIKVLKIKIQLLRE